MTSIIKKNKITIITIAILLVLVNILNVLAPYFLKLIIDKITTNSKAEYEKIKNYLTEIKYDEISNHVIEQPSSVIYVSNSSEDSTKKFENIFIPVVKKYNLENEIIYININGITVVDPFYQSAPELVFYTNGEVSDVIDVSTLKTKDDVIKVLKERSVIND